MIRFLIFTLMLSIPAFGCDSDLDGFDDNLAAITTQLAKLKAYQLKVNLKTPKEDAIERLKIGDFRLLWMPTNPVYPASEKNSQLITEELACKLGDRVIEGAGNPIESEEQAILSDRFFSYAVVYNDTVLENWQKYLAKKNSKTKKGAI